MIISGEPLLYRLTGASFVEHRFFDISFRKLLVCLSLIHI